MIIDFGGVDAGDGRPMKRRFRPAATGRGRPAAPKPYKAFISYSHAVDGRLAPALQAALQQFAKRWYQLRALRVFRDQASLSATPALWPSIERALGDSEFFILLASPEAARSEWVNREVAWWTVNKDVGKLLIGRTGGTIVWDPEAGDFDWPQTSALPPVLRGSFRDEPRYVDLGWAAADDHLSMRDPRFRDCVADLAAPLHDRPKDELFGEDVRQHRRAVRLARGAVATLCVLAVISAAAAIIAVKNQRQATAQARVATSRELAATSRGIADAQFDLALLLGAEALRIKDTPQARASLFFNLERNPQHVAFLRGTGATLTVVRVSADGGSVVAGDVDGSVTLWRVPDGTLVRQLRIPDSTPVESLAFAPDSGRVVVGSRNGDVALWDLATGQRHQVHHYDQPVRAVAFSPDGNSVASGDAKGGVVVSEVSTGDQASQVPPKYSFPSGPSDDSVSQLLFTSDGRQLAVVGRGGVISRRDLETGREISHEALGLGAHTSFAVFSDDLSLEALTGGGGGSHVDITSRVESTIDASAPLGGAAESLAFSPDGQLLAAADQGAVHFFKAPPVPRATALEPDGQTPVLTGYPAAIASMSFSADRRWLAAASGDRVVLSDLRLGHRLGLALTQPEDVCLACNGSAVSVSPDGNTLAWLDPGGFTGAPRIRLWDLRRATEVGSFEVDEKPAALAFRPDGRSLATVGRSVVVWDLDGHRLTPPSAPAPLGSSLLSVSFTPDGRGLLVMLVADPASHGSKVVVRDLDDGKVRFEEPTSAPVAETAASSGGMLAAARDDGSIRLADLRLGRDVAVLHPDPPQTATGTGGVEALAFDGGGTQLASLSAGTVTVWDVAGHRPRFSLRWGKTGTVRFSPKGDLLVAAGSDGAITLWDVASRQLLGTLQGQNPLGAFPEMVFTADSRTMVSVVAGGGVMLWDLSIDGWLRDACALAGRDLTAAERQSFVGAGLTSGNVCPKGAFRGPG